MGKLVPAGLWLLFAAQALLFCNYVHREVSWGYPSAFDQAYYLNASYALYLDTLGKGMWKSIGDFLNEGRPNGIMLPIQGMIAQFFFGSTRLANLSLNLAYFALLQGTMFSTARALLGRNVFGWLAVGMLLLQQSAFFWAGGLFDFRIDFIASCLYGCFVCCAVRSDGFRLRRWVVAMLSCGCLLISFRFITLAFLLGFFGLLFGGYFLLWVFRPSRLKPLIDSAVFGMKRSTQLALGTMVLVTPMLWPNLRAIQNYYVVGHLTGDEKHVRAAEFGVEGLTGHLTFYLRSLVRDHLGAWFVAVWLVVLALGLLGRFVASRHAASAGGGEQPGKDGTSRQTSFMIVLAAVLAPWLILTVDISKSPVVASMFGPPLVLFALLSLGSREKSLGTRALAGSFTSLGWASLTGIVLVLGCGHWLNSLCERGALSQRRASVQEINSLYLNVAAGIEESDLPAPVVSTDMVVDWLWVTTLNVQIYERTGRWLNLGGSLGRGIAAVTREAVFSELARSDVVLLTDFPKVGFYPFYDSIRPLASEMRAWCETHRLRDRESQIDGGKVTTYVRAKVPMEGLSGEWITPQGVQLRFSESLLNMLRTGRKSVLIMEGTDHIAWLKDAPTVSARPVGSAGIPVSGPAVNLPTTFEQLTPDRYRVRLDLRELLAAPPGATNVFVELKFENASFVPKEIGLNEDARRLVVIKPTVFDFE